MIQALIFDFDGLIFDSETPDFISWQETYAHYGVELPRDVWNAHIGSVTFNPYQYLEGLLGQPIDKNAVWTRRKARDNELLAAQTIMPGVENYLAGGEAVRACRLASLPALTIGGWMLICSGLACLISFR